MSRGPLMLQAVVCSAAVAAGIAMSGSLWSSPAAAEGRYLVRPVAEMKIKHLPKWPLYWRIENYATLDQAKAAAPPFRWNLDTVSYEGRGSAGEVAGKVWLFTLGRRQDHRWLFRCRSPPRSADHSIGISAAREPRIWASLQDARSHSSGLGSVLCRQRPAGQRTPHGVSHVEAGQTMNGHHGDMPMQVFNSGSTDLTALIMFVVDAAKPFSVPAKFP